MMQTTLCFPGACVSVLFGQESQRDGGNGSDDSIVKP